MIPTAFKHMDKNGFLPKGIKCDQCGKELSGENGPRPAESYAGSFTGLCYSCQNGGPYIVKEHFDGAITRSYPPHSPSWRRDREEQTGYPDCPECNGSGRKYHDQPLSRGGGYYGYCEPCFNKYYNHPLRKVYHEITQTVGAHIYGKYENMFHAALEKAGLPTVKSDDLTDEQKQKILDIAISLLEAFQTEDRGACDKLRSIYEEGKTGDHKKAIRQMKKAAKELMK